MIHIVNTRRFSTKAFGLDLEIFFNGNQLKSSFLSRLFAYVVLSNFDSVLVSVRDRP